MSYPANDLIETVKALPEERQDEVREFIGLLGMSDEIIAVAMEWITDRLPDRYCADDPRFDVQKYSWHLPIILSYLQVARAVSLAKWRSMLAPMR